MRSLDGYAAAYPFGDDRRTRTFPARVRAAVTMRSIRPGGSMRSTRHRTSRASVNRSSTNSTGHNSAVSHAISCSSSVRVQGRNPSASRICLRVVLGGPAGEGVLPELRSRHFHQLRDVLDRGLRDLLDKLREPALLLKYFRVRAKPSRVGPLSLATKSQSLSTGVQHVTTSSGSHSYRMPCLFFPRGPHSFGWGQR